MNMPRFANAAGKARRVAASLPVLLAVLALVSACGSAAPAPAGSSPGRPSQTGELPQRGGSLAVRLPAWTGDPPSLDPYLNTSFRTQNTAGMFYSRLLMYETGPNIKPNSFQVIGDLAEKWDVSSDGLTYTFHLRDNAKWHNLPPLNGRKVTADDVLYSYNRFVKDGVQKTALGAVKDVKAADASTVSFTLKNADATFENLIASPIFWIIPREVVEQDGDLNKRVVGSGPFIWSKYDRGVQIVGKRNPDYYFKDQPYLDELDLLIVPDDVTGVASFRSKQIDVFSYVPQTQRDGLVKSYPDAVLTEFTQNLMGFLYWRLDAKPFNDVRVRRAVSMALNRDEITSIIYEGRGIYNSHLPAGLPRWWLDPTGSQFGQTGQYFKHDAAKAKSLLAEAGYPEGLKNVPFIASLNAYGDAFNQTVELIQKQLKEAGIEVKFGAQDYAAYISSTYLGKFDGGTMVQGLETPVSDPSDYLFAMYHPQGQRNHGGVNDSKLTEMIDKQRITLDQAERKKQIDDIQRYLADQMYYVTYPASQVTAVSQPWVKDFYWETDFGLVSEVFRKVWVKGKP
jgi:peptide/nickel transport system substrate-binding protein